MAHIPQPQLKKSSLKWSFDELRLAASFRASYLHPLAGNTYSDPHNDVLLPPNLTKKQKKPRMTEVLPSYFLTGFQTMTLIVRGNANGENP